MQPFDTSASLAAARQRASGDQIITPGKTMTRDELIAHMDRLDAYFKNPADPWRCTRCGCEFVPGEYRVIDWHTDQPYDAEARAYCASCSVLLVRCRPLERKIAAGEPAFTVLRVPGGTMVTMGTETISIPDPIPAPERQYHDWYQAADGGKPCKYCNGHLAHVDRRFVVIHDEECPAMGRDAQLRAAGKAGLGEFRTAVQPHDVAP